MSVRKAAKKIVVPTIFVHTAVKNPEKTNLKSGPPSILSAEVENYIVNWIWYRAEKGYPVTKVQLLDSVQIYSMYLILEIKSPRLHLLKRDLCVIGMKSSVCV